MTRDFLTVVLEFLGIVTLVLVPVHCTAISGSSSEVTLFTAAKEGNASLVERILVRGVDVNARDTYGLTALHWASHRGRSNVVRLLLRKGADLNVHAVPRNSMGLLIGCTPLHCAILARDAETVRLLVAGGADVNVKRSWDGSSPLLLACGIGSRVPIGASIGSICDGSNAKEAGTDSPFGNQVSSTESFPVTEVVELLLSKGADADSKDVCGRTPLLAACRTGHLEVAKLLLASGAHIDVRDAGGRGPLDEACSTGCPELIRLLLANGAQIASSTRKSSAIIRDGPCLRFPEVVEQLLAKDKETGPQRPTLLHLASFVGNAEAVKLLLDHGTDVNARDTDGFKALWLSHTAARNSSTQDQGMCQQAEPSRWLSRLVDSSRSMRPKCFQIAEVLTPGGTALHWACLGGQIEVVRLLLARGADVDVVDNEGHAPLHVASAVHSPAVVKALLDNDARVNLKDLSGRPPLAWALSTAETTVLLTSGGVYSMPVIREKVEPKHLEWDERLCQFSKPDYDAVLQLLEAYGAKQ
jgi:ankyrin repeat protein